LHLNTAQLVFVWNKPKHPCVFEAGPSSFLALQGPRRKLLLLILLCGLLPAAATWLRTAEGGSTKQGGLKLCLSYAASAALSSRTHTHIFMLRLFRLSIDKKVLWLASSFKCLLRGWLRSLIIQKKYVQYFVCSAVII
jgi:hypothetical protein